MPYERDTVIISKSLETSEVHRLLSKYYRPRVANGTLHHSIIFPKSSVAFMIQPICELCLTWPPSGKYFIDMKMVDRLQQFNRIHRNAYVFLTSANINEDESIVIEAVEHQFCESKVTFLPVRGASAIVTVMLRMLQPKNELLTRIEAAKKSLNGEVDESQVCHILEKNLQLSSHDAMVLQDGCSTVATIATSSVDQIKDCSLSHHTAEKIFGFFHESCKKNTT